MFLADESPSKESSPARQHSYEMIKECGPIVMDEFHLRKSHNPSVNPIDALELVEQIALDGFEGSPT